MLRRRRPRRPLYVDMHFSLPGRAGAVLLFLVLLASVIAFTAQAALYLRELSCAMALSDATDLMTLCINNAISEKMREGDYSYDYFVALEKSDNGGVVALKTNMSRINAFSAELLSDVVRAADNGSLEIDIPLGNLVGSSLLLGRGPDIPVEITMLTSSRVDCLNELSEAGINQTKHQIKLDVVIDIDVILPWKTQSTQVVSEILVAETVIVGSVPQTYLNMG